MEVRFWAKVRKGEPGECWMWTACNDGHGYGVLEKPFGIGGYAKAHRVSWELHRGPIPKGMSVLHRCDVRGCVNPDHLFLGTTKDNMADAARKLRCGRTKATIEQIRQIRDLWNQGVSKRKIAQRVGLSSGAVYCIAVGKSFAHIPLATIRTGRVSRSTG